MAEKDPERQQTKKDLQAINKFYAPELERIKQESECYGKHYDPESTYCKKLCYCPDDCEAACNLKKLDEEVEPVNRFMIDKKKKGVKRGGKERRF